MTTRVQKGGTIFRPMAKAKARSQSTSLSRQPSVISDAITQAESRPNETRAAVEALMMPPPADYGASHSQSIPAIPNLAVHQSIPTSSSQTEHLVDAFNSTRLESPAPHLVMRASSNAPPLIARASSNAPPLIARAPSIAPPLIARAPSNAPPIVRAPSNAPPTVARAPSNAPPTLFVSQAGPSQPGPSTSSLHPSPLVPITPSSLGQPIMVPQPFSMPMHAPPIIPVANATSTIHQHFLIDSTAMSSAMTPSPAIHTAPNDIIPQPPPPLHMPEVPTEAGAANDATSSAPGDQPAKKTSRRKKSSDPAAKRAPRKRKATSPTFGEEDQSEQRPTQRRRKSKTGDSVPRTRKTRSPSVPVFDANADPGEELDPTTITMAALCSDTGQGRVSSKAAEIQSNFANWKTQSREKRARLRAIAEAKKYGRTEEEAIAAADEGESGAGPSENPPTPPLPTPAAALSTATNEDPDSFDYTQDMATSRFNVQVRIGPNGETIIDEASLVVDRQEDVDTSGYTHVVESDTTKFVNSGSYGKKCRGSRWSKEETEIFYHALSQYGENYELLAYVMPGRDRKACKNKFKAEDKKNPTRISHCLDNRIPVDMQTLSRMTGKDFSGPVPEIRIPTPAPPPPPPPAEPTSDAESSAAPSRQNAPKKRSRSRSAAITDDVQILGTADTFIAFDEE
ncbi:hypothetical protein HGRIS_008201 [Hohenbuehelia grisea]|uniref:Myb-like domain-containing protein n=1 Tax=Hohenbuehelia grisea TaxID=104357 RepID=A0ABR3J7M8_9AGAR